MSARASLLVLTLALAACARTPQAPVPSAERRPLERIVAAVQDHDRRCARPVPRRERVAEELGITECTTEVDPAELGDCLREIEEQPCSRDVLRVPTCRIGALCNTTEEGTL